MWRVTGDAAHAARCGRCRTMRPMPHDAADAAHRAPGRRGTARSDRSCGSDLAFCCDPRMSTGLTIFAERFVEAKCGGATQDLWEQ